MAKIPEWVKERVKIEGWSKKIEGILIEKRVALEPVENVNIVKYYKRKYSLRVPRIPRYRLVYLKLENFRYNYSHTAKMWLVNGLIPNVVNFVSGSNMLLWLSMRHPLMSDFSFKISKKATPITDKQVEKLVREGRAYPYAIEIRGKTIAIGLKA